MNPSISQTNRALWLLCKRLYLSAVLGTKAADNYLNLGSKPTHNTYLSTSLQANVYYVPCGREQKRKNRGGAGDSSLMECIPNVARAAVRFPNCGKRAEIALHAEDGNSPCSNLRLKARRAWTTSTTHSAMRKHCNGTRDFERQQPTSKKLKLRPRYLVFAFAEGGKSRGVTLEV